MFITFEGVGGAGKTTQAGLLYAALLDEGRDVVLTHEPGGTKLGERLRRVLLEDEPPDVTISPWTEATLFAAARAELVTEVIAPTLTRGALVVCDRFIDSSLAYQGIGRGLGVEPVLALNRLVVGDVFPDQTFLLTVDLDDALRRRVHVDR